MKMVHSGQFARISRSSVYSRDANLLKDSFSEGRRESGMGPVDSCERVRNIWDPVVSLWLSLQHQCRDLCTSWALHPAQQWPSSLNPISKFQSWASWQHQTLCSLPNPVCDGLMWASNKITDDVGTLYFLGSQIPPDLRLACPWICDPKSP